MSEVRAINTIASVIESILLQQGIDGIVSRGSQPSHQGAGTDECPVQVFLTQVSSSNYGTSWKDSATNDALSRTLIRSTGATIQVDVLAKFDYTDSTAKSGLTIAEILSDMVETPGKINTMRESGVRLKNVGEIRPSYKVNEFEKYESAPSFDIEIQINRSYEYAIDGVTLVETGLYRV